jgi:cytochrome c-type biogenesis protein CcmH/NrfG
MATTRLPALDEDAPSLDPSAIERAYIRERARRRLRSDRRTEARSSNARFWVVLAVLLFLTVCIALFAWHQVQTTFGV